MEKINWILLLLVFTSCLKAKHKEGTCILARGGYYWYISSAGMSDYTVRGWQGRFWGRTTKLSHDILDQYDRVACPAGGR